MKLYKKLLEIQTTLKGLKKDKKNYQFDYLSGSKLLSYIRPLMDEKGIILKQEVLTIENERIDYKTKNGEKSEILTKAMMRFTWIDVETGEKDENLFGANGQNDWEKGLGSALTYAERYFIMKYFHLPTDEDDIDNPERKEEERLEKKRIEEEKILTKEQFETALKSNKIGIQATINVIKKGKKTATKEQLETLEKTLKLSK